MLSVVPKEAASPQPALQSDAPALLVLCAEPIAREAYVELAATAGYAVQSCERAEQLWRQLERHAPEAILLDPRSSEPALLELLREVKARSSEVQVLLISSAATVMSAVQAVREGAFEYLGSPLDVDALNAALDRMLLHLQMRREGRGLRERLRTRNGYGGLVGHSSEMEKLYRMISKAAFS